MTARVLTTCHTQYTWDSSICIFLFNRTTLQVFVTYLTGALYMHPLWFYKHQHDNRVCSTQNASSLPFAAILVNGAPSGEMHNYCTLHIIKKIWEFLDPSVQLHTAVSSVCVWQVVKTPTIILNNPVYYDARSYKSLKRSLYVITWSMQLALLMRPRLAVECCK